MGELILSDITIMGPGYCVIGLEQFSQSCFRSVRPMPPWGFAWRDPFEFTPGDCVRLRSRPIRATPPHVEDCKSNGLSPTGRSLNEQELVECLKKAELGDEIEGLFECPVETSSRGGRALWVNPSQARWSVCGCVYENLRFRIYPDREGLVLRAGITLSSNERMDSIPVVDREWRRFVNRLTQRIKRSDPLPLAERFLNRTVCTRLLAMPQLFARIGLPRPRGDPQCWLMLDSLFPQPDESWLDLL